jgi:hypothetical protein
LDQVVVVGYGAKDKRHHFGYFHCVNKRYFQPANRKRGRGHYRKGSGVQVSVPSGMPGSDLSVK